MAFTYAGRYGPEIFEDENRHLLKAKPISVFNAGTNVLADLYLDRSKDSAGPNPFITDARGNGYFFADPGEYDVDYAGWRLPVTVDMDPVEAQGDGPPTGPAAGDLDGDYPDPTIRGTWRAAVLAEAAGAANVDAAAQVEAHRADTTVVHGIADTALLELTTRKGQNNGYAGLDANGKVPNANLPPLAINETFVAASQAAMLALAAQRGDMARRTDLNPNKIFILTTDNPGTLADWLDITATAGTVSVDGRSGVVVLNDLYAPLAHAARHIPGGADAIDLTKIHGSGSALPALPSALWPAGALFFDDDLNGGTLFRVVAGGAAWVQVAPGVTETAGVELGYAEVTVTPPAFTTNVLTDIAGMLITFATGARPAYIKAIFPQCSNNTALMGGLMAITGGAVYQDNISFSATANAYQEIIIEARVPPNTASATYKCQASWRTGGQLTLGALPQRPLKIYAVTR